jgi:hypothetical protein
MPSSRKINLEKVLASLDAGFLQDRDVGVGALGKEILVISQRPR